MCPAKTEILVSRNGSKKQLQEPPIITGQKNTFAFVPQTSLLRLLP